MVRVGSVPYLNARPLLEGLPFPIMELVPAQLCEGFRQGMFDAALISSIDVLSQSDAFVVDGVAIGSMGAVYSVILAYTGELTELTKILLDSSSHTSNGLLQVILGEFYGLNPDYVQITDTKPSFLPKVLIGDPAILFRSSPRASEVKILDLGAEWYRHTGLPFVFALWLLRNEFTQKKLLSEALRSAKFRGLNHLSEIASRAADPAFALRYFTEYISYEFGEEEKRGLELFHELLMKHHLLETTKRTLRFV